MIHGRTLVTIVHDRTLVTMVHSCTLVIIIHNRTLMIMISDRTCAVTVRTFDGIEWRSWLIGHTNIRPFFVAIFTGIENIVANEISENVFFVSIFAVLLIFFVCRRDFSF